MKRRIAFFIVDCIRIAVYVVGFWGLFTMVAHADESWFQWEAGLGAAVGGPDDGRWYQESSPHTLSVVTPAATVGVGGPLYRSADWGVDWHLSAIYIAQMSASCTCVPDADYNASTHEVTGNGPKASFYGHGSEVGFLAELSPYYLYKGYKVAVSAGAYVFRQFWRETTIQPNGVYYDVSHAPVWMVTWAAGASISKGPWTLAYHYLADGTKYNPSPGLVTHTHLITVTYRF